MRLLPVSLFNGEDGAINAEWRQQMLQLQWNILNPICDVLGLFFRQEFPPFHDLGEVWRYRLQGIYRDRYNDPDTCAIRIEPFGEVANHLFDLLKEHVLLGEAGGRHNNQISCFDWIKIGCQHSDELSCIDVVKRVEETLLPISDSVMWIAIFTYDDTLAWPYSQFAAVFDNRVISADCNDLGEFNQRTLDSINGYNGASAIVFLTLELPEDIE